MINQEYVADKKILATKLAIVSTIQYICSILIIVYGIKTAITFRDYGWGINQVGPDNLLNLEAQNTRALLLASCTIFCLCAGFSLYYSLTFKKFSFNALPWCFLVNGLFFAFYWWKAFKSRELDRLLHNRLNFAYPTPLINLDFKNQTSRWIRINTGVFFFAIAVFTVGFILIFMNGENVAYKEPTDIWFINKLSYFTNLTNIACCFYLWILLFFHKREAVNSSGIIISLCVYILVVGLVYWILLFPYHVAIDEGGGGPIMWTRRIWLHTITPLAFLIFTLTSFATKHLKMTPIKSLCLRGLIYPLTYGLYMYSLPFLTQVVIYGSPTNLNPHMILSGQEAPKGNPWYVLAVPLAAGAFAGLLALFYWFNKKIHHHERY